MSHILVFDVNETLMDLNSLEPHFVRMFGDPSILREWFNQVILHAQAVTLADQYRNFGEIGRASLEMLADSEGVNISSKDIEELIDGMRTLPPHAEIVESLTRLQDAGVRMVTLTNSPPAIVDSQMENGKLKSFFERSFSVDTVRKFKPAPEPYRMVAEALGVPTNELMMIAAHSWDLAGAMRTGYAGAFVARPGKALFSAFPKPDIIGKDLLEVSQMILAARG